MTLSLRRAALAATASALVALSAGQLVPSPSGAVAAPATSTAGDSIGRLPHERTVKPFSPGVVTIDPASITAGSPDVSVEVAPDATHADPVLTITATGEASVDEGAQAVPDGQPSDVSVGAALSDGEGAITATLTGTAPDGRTETTSDTVWVDTVDGTVVTSELGTQDLRLKAIDLREAKGLLTAEAADAFRAEATGGGADTVVAAGPDPSCVDICVSGTVRWTDSAGGTHPVRKAPVEVYDEEVGADQLIATAVTDDTGAYAFADFDTNDGPGEGGRDVYVRVLAAGPGFDVVGQHIDSPVTSNVPVGTALPTDLTANNVDDNNTAFSLQNAMVVAGEYVLGVRGAAFPDIDVIFPGPGSFYDGTALNMLQGDRFDWDVMLHEYGHYVADELNIENNPGGSHSSSSNLSVTRGSKTIGIPLAFGEGWPTYFAVSLLSEMGTAALNIPNIGDTSYQDTEDQVITEDLETGGTLGEDNELTVMSTLWDLYDSVDDGVDRVSLGSSAIWNLLDANDPTTLSAAYQLFAPDTGDASDGASCIFGQYNVSPVVTTPPTDDLGAGSPSPALSWTAGNGGTFFNDSFVVEYRTTAGGLLFASPTLAATTYQAGASDWAAIKAASGGTVVVTVLGTQTAAPVTGAYRSCRRTFAVEVVNPTTTTTTSTTTTTTTTTSTTVPDSTTTTSTTVPDSTTTTSTTVPDSTTTTSTTVPDSTTTTSTTVPDSTTTTSTTVPDSTTTTSTTVPVSTTTTTVPDSTTTSTVPGTTPTTTPPTVPGTTPTTTGPTTTTTPGTPTTDPGPDTTVGTDPTTTVVVPPTDGTPATSVPGDVSGGGVDDGGGVSGGGRALPRTGSDSSTPVTVGLVLVALGAGFALVARRRRTLA